MITKQLKVLHIYRARMLGGGGWINNRCGILKSQNSEGSPSTLQQQNPIFNYCFIVRKNYVKGLL